MQIKLQVFKNFINPALCWGGESSYMTSAAVN